MCIELFCDSWITFVHSERYARLKQQMVNERSQNAHLKVLPVHSFGAFSLTVALAVRALLLNWHEFDWNQF